MELRQHLVAMQLISVTAIGGNVTHSIDNVKYTNGCMARHTVPLYLLRDRNFNVMQMSPSS